MKNLQPGAPVFVKNTNSIDVIIETGTDTRQWFRTDSDGTREAHELTVIKTREQLTGLIEAGAQITPNTQNQLKNYFNFKQSPG